MMKVNPRYALIAACLIGLAGCKLESNSTITKIDTTINSDVLVPITLKHTGDNTAITNIRVSTTAPTLVSQQASTCPATLNQNQSCVVTLKLNTTLANQGKFDVLVKYRNTRGEQTVEPNLTIKFNVANPAQQTFMRYGTASGASYLFGSLATGFFNDSSIGANGRKFVDPLTGESVRKIGSACSFSYLPEFDANGTCIRVDSPWAGSIGKVYKVDGDGNVLFEYEYSYTSGYPNISLFADGTAVFADFKSTELPYNDPVNYYFFNSSGQLLFEKAGPVGQYRVEDGSVGIVKQVKNGDGRAYYTITGSQAFDTYDAEGNKVCSGSPAFTAPVGWVNAVKTEQVASDRPTNEIYYVNSFPLAFESNGVNRKPFTSRTILTFDMLTCQQTNSKTITSDGISDTPPSTNINFSETNGKIFGLELDSDGSTSYFDAATQSFYKISATTKYEMFGLPVLRNGSIYDQGRVESFLIPWQSEGYYLFNLQISSSTGGSFPTSDVFTVMGHNVSPTNNSNGRGSVILWGIARLNANGKLVVSKAINTAN